MYVRFTFIDFLSFRIIFDSAEGIMRRIRSDADNIQPAVRHNLSASLRAYWMHRIDLTLAVSVQFKRHASCGHYMCILHVLYARLEETGSARPMVTVSKRAFNFGRTHVLCQIDRQTCSLLSHVLYALWDMAFVRMRWEPKRWKESCVRVCECMHSVCRWTARSRSTIQ